MTAPRTAAISRRTVLRAASAAALAGPPASRRARAAGPFAALDDKIAAAMAAYAIPGVAIGIRDQGADTLRTYGVTNVDDPQPVDADTLFRIGPTTKTFSGTAAMRLVEAGTLDLDARVRAYLPDFATLDPTVAEAVTVRQLLNHSAGWMGDGTPLDMPAEAPQLLAFYRDDYALMCDGAARPLGDRTDFVRDGAGRVAWFRFGGRLNRKLA